MVRRVLRKFFSGLRLFYFVLGGYFFSLELQGGSKRVEVLVFYLALVVEKVGVL